MRVDEMPAGREMDAIIKKHVFSQEPQYACFVDGCREEECVKDECDCLMAYKLSEAGKKYPNDCEYWRILDPAPYSDNIAAAWEVVQQVSGAKHWKFKIRRLPGKDWIATFTRLGNLKNGPIEYGSSPCDDAPLAICQAALKAMGVEEA